MASNSLPFTSYTLHHIQTHTLLEVNCTSNPLPHISHPLHHTQTHTLPLTRLIPSIPSPSDSLIQTAESLLFEGHLKEIVEPTTTTDWWKSMAATPAPLLPPPTRPNLKIDENKSTRELEIRDRCGESDRREQTTTPAHDST